MIESGICNIPAEVEFLTQKNIHRYIIRDLNANITIASPDLEATNFAQSATYT